MFVPSYLLRLIVQGTLARLPGSESGSESGSQKHFTDSPTLMTNVIVWTQPAIQQRPNWHRMMRKRETKHSMVIL